MPSSDRRPLSEPVFLTLLGLSRGPRHGYAILQEVAEWTGGRVELRTATLYTALARLVDDGLAAETDAPPEEADADPRRRYYRLTGAGEVAVRAEADRMRDLVRLSDRLVSGTAP